MKAEAPTFTAFAGDRLLARGPLTKVAPAVKRALTKGTNVLTFCDESGRVIDLDLRGSEAEIAALYDATPAGEATAGDGEATPGVRGRGRPKLGVVAREITLLPRHWEWLARQRHGASQALRRLVDEARRAEEARSGPKLAQERAYRFMSAIAGDLPGFEEASRALFADDGEALKLRTESWPEAIGRYLRELAGIADTGQSPNG